MQTNMVVHAGRALLELGAATLRFNFRGVGRSVGQHDGRGGEREDYRVALAALRDRCPGLPLLAAGCSFGALRAMECCGDPEVHGCVAIVPPVTHPANQPPPVAHGPAAVILAAQDELVPRPSDELLAEVYPELVRLEVVAGADHLFTDVLPAYRDAVRACAEALLRES
jgi:alpha/beta superfamily hydrolase